MSYYDNGTAGRDRLANTTTWTGEANTLPTGKRLYAPHSKSVGGGVVDAQQVIENTETTIVSRRGALATAGLVGLAGFAIAESTK